MAATEVVCGVCKKPVDPEASWHLVRRSSLVAKVADWEYFGISPVFFACSYQHYAILFTNWSLVNREIAEHQLGELFQLKEPSDE